MEFYRVKVTFLNHYKLSVKSHKEIIKLIKKQFTIIGVVKSYVNWGDNPGLKEREKKFKVYERVSTTEITLDAGLVDYLAICLSDLYRIVKFHLEMDIPKVTPIKLTPFWNEILRDNQKEDVEKLTSYFGGTSSQHTGYGKTVVLLSLLDSYNHRCLLQVPTNSIKEEIMERSIYPIKNVHHPIDIGVNDWSKRINIINPTGFLRSRQNNREAWEWMKGVVMVITDESHHLQSKSSADVFKRLPNVRRSYGFSASADAVNGDILTPYDTPLPDMSYNSAKIVGLSGSVRVLRKTKTELTLVKVFCNITKGGPDVIYDSWNEALDELLVSPKLAAIISHIIHKYKDVIWYIPVHKVETALVLHENLQKFGNKGIFWSSKYVFPEEIVENKKEVLPSIKKAIDSNTYRYVISTTVSYEGVDIPKLGGFIPLTGKFFRMVVQPAGRSARGPELISVLIYDGNNPVVLGQCKKRREHLESEYNIVQESTLRL